MSCKRCHAQSAAESQLNQSFLVSVRETWRREKARVLARWSKKCWIISRLSQKRSFSHSPPSTSLSCLLHVPVCVCGCWAVPHVLGVSHQIRPRWQKGLLHTGECCGCKRSYPQKKNKKQSANQPVSEQTNNLSRLTNVAATSAATCVYMYMWCLDWWSVFCSTLMALDAWT